MNPYQIRAKHEKENNNMRKWYSLPVFLLGLGMISGCADGEAPLSGQTEGSASQPLRQARPGALTDSVLAAARRLIAHDLRHSARRAGVSIKTNDMIIGSRNDVQVAIAQVTDNTCDMFGYFELPASSGLPVDVYEIDIEPAPNFEGQGRAVFRDTRGQIVLSDVPVLHERIPGGLDRDGLSLAIEAEELSAKRWKPDQGTTPGLHIVDIITIRF